AALRFGFELQCSLPFDVESYQQDFGSEESCVEFRRLLALASAVLQLDGSRETPERQNQSYADAGRMVLGQCDALIAIWDGEPARGVGGTGQIVQEALDLGIPTVKI